MNFAYDLRYREAHKAAQKAADAAYEIGVTKEDKFRRYFETYNKHMADWAREEEQRVPREIEPIVARFLKGYADGTAENIKFTASRCPQCDRVVPTGDRCAHCEGV